MKSCVSFLIFLLYFVISSGVNGAKGVKMKVITNRMNQLEEKIDNLQNDVKTILSILRSNKKDDVKSTKDQAKDTEKVPRTNVEKHTGVNCKGSEGARARYVSLSETKCLDACKKISGASGCQHSDEWCYVFTGGRFERGDTEDDVTCWNFSTEGNQDRYDNSYCKYPGSSHLALHMNEADCLTRCQEMDDLKGCTHHDGGSCLAYTGGEVDVGGKIYGRTCWLIKNSS